MEDVKKNKETALAEKDAEIAKLKVEVQKMNEEAKKKSVLYNDPTSGVIKPTIFGKSDKK